MALASSEMSGLHKEKTGPLEAVTHNRLHWEVLGQGDMAREAHPSKRLPRDSYKAASQKGIGQGNTQGRCGNLSQGLVSGWLLSSKVGVF